MYTYVCMCIYIYICTCRIEQVNRRQGFCSRDVKSCNSATPMYAHVGQREIVRCNVKLPPFMPSPVRLPPRPRGGSPC